eukprot:CAMPEP_0171214898 /NCGR_PEP_ID=MMETSP0790-20130122/31392_1 /TAXON_ID=2925 /ORGANISM="Alexandrium catenella, Strain OF101" /LENGTH=164 /DNA_ID=CAMNT_0011680641 /DNA_START=38 /DNA_END=532 /DNA_ORIENTATION=-
MAIVTQDVDLGGLVEKVFVDEKGPKVLQIDGRYESYNYSPEVYSIGYHPADHKGLSWNKLTKTERTVMLNIIAKANFNTKLRMHELQKEGGAALDAASRGALGEPTAPKIAATGVRYKRRPPCFTGMVIDASEESKAAEPTSAKTYWWSGQPVGVPAAAPRKKK